MALRREELKMQISCIILTHKLFTLTQTNTSSATTCIDMYRRKQVDMNYT